MKKRKERIEQEKALQFIENFRSVKKATTYIGTTVLMGTAGVGLSRTKALADSTVQVADGQGDPNKNAQATTNTTNAAGNNAAAQKQTTAAQGETANTGQTAAATNNATQGTSSAQDTTTQPTESTDANSLLRSVATTYSSPQAFIAQIAPQAVQIARQRGLYASMMIAQASLESGWSSSLLATSAHNLFGVKWSGSGAYVKMNTNEYYGGKNHVVSAKFQKYSSYTESLNNYANLIIGHFPNSTIGRAGSVKQATINLAHGVYGTYATDPNYAASLQNLIQRYNLTQYDSQGSTSQTPSTSLGNAGSGQTSQATNTSNSSTTSGSYTVKAGDNLYRIAINHGLTVAQLKSLNNLTTDNIQVGQKLVVKGGRNTNKGNTTNNTNSKPPRTSQTSNTSTTQTSTSSAKTYIVQPKDSLWSISQKFKVTVNDLRKWNNLKTDIIYVKQKLKVTAGKTTQSHSSQQTSKPTTSQTATGNSSSKGQTTYTVKKDDSLWSIAHSHNLSVDQVKKLNNLSSDLIHIGQKLILSRASKQTSKPTTTKPTKTTGKQQSSGTYTVKSGDSLWSIAQAHNMSVTSLKSVNKLSSDLITVGQKLKVTGTNKSASGKTQTTSSLKAKTTQKTSTNTANGTYVVKKNDSLWSIANAHNTTIAKIRSLNHLTGSVIYIGQTLKVSAKSTVNTTSQKTKTTSKSTYTVQAQDSLWRIATRNKLTVNQLKALNHLVSDTIYVGQTLKLK